MAMIANTAFEARVTNGHFDETLNITGRFHNGDGDDEICPAGFLCVRGDKMPVNGFSAYSYVNENAYYMGAAASTVTASEPIYAANPYDWQLIPAGDEAFSEGVNTLGLPILSGREGTFTRIVFDGANIYRFGEGNIDGSVSTNKFFTIKDGLLKPQASAPTDNGAVYFKLWGSGKFTEGVREAGTYYDVVAYSVAAAAPVPAPELPAVSSTDNGDVLTVVEGVWAKAAPAEELPAVTSDDAGDVLTVDNTGAWVNAAPSGGAPMIATDTAQEVQDETIYALDKTAGEIWEAANTRLVVINYQTDDGREIWTHKSVMVEAGYRPGDEQNDTPPVYAFTTSNGEIWRASALNEYPVHDI